VVAFTLKASLNEKKKKFDFLKKFCYNIYTKFKENQKIIFLFIKEVATKVYANQHQERRSWPGSCEAKIRPVGRSNYPL
jgi:hypothetical protein